MREETVEKGSIWRHFKGNIIEVICVCKHTEDVSNRVDNITKQKYRFERILKK